MTKFNRIIAIIALVFVGAASVFLVMFLFDSEMFTGLGNLLMYTAGIGLLLFVYLWLVKKKVDREEKYLKDAEEAQNSEESEAESASATEAETKEDAQNAKDGAEK